MKWLKNLVVTLVFGLSLQACSVVGPIEPVASIPVPASLSEAGQTAQKVINEVNVLLASAARLTLQNLNDGYYTRAEALDIRDTLLEYRDKSDSAQAALDLGDAATATSKAELVSKLTVEIIRVIRKRAAAAGSMG